jgi:hypothetical protein
MLQARALPCVRTVSKPYLFWPLGLAFERKADAPSYCKERIIEGSDGGFGAFSAACKAGALPAELHAHTAQATVYHTVAVISATG